MEKWFIALSLPLAMCIFLPVIIAWLYFKYVNNRVNKCTEVITKAIEANVCPEKLTGVFESLRDTAEEILHIRLLRGCIFTLLGLSMMMMTIAFSNDGLQRLMWFLSAVCFSIGIGYLIVYFVTKKSIKEEKEEQRNIE